MHGEMFFATFPKALRLFLFEKPLPDEKKFVALLGTESKFIYLFISNYSTFNPVIPVLKSRNNENVFRLPPAFPGYFC
jgi:hypothetical protein